MRKRETRQSEFPKVINFLRVGNSYKVLDKEILLHAQLIPPNDQWSNQRTQKPAKHLKAPHLAGTTYSKLAFRLFKERQVKKKQTGKFKALDELAGRSDSSETKWRLVVE